MTDVFIIILVFAAYALFGWGAWWVQGYAGTGKTTMLRRAVSCLGERRVLGLAPSASVARTLSRETGLACRTLQWFLTRCQEVSDIVVGGPHARQLEGGHHHHKPQTSITCDLRG